MKERELMKESDVHAFGVEIVYKQLTEAGWTVQSADVYATRTEHPRTRARSARVHPRASNSSLMKSPGGQVVAIRLESIASTLDDQLRLMPSRRRSGIRRCA